NDPLEVAVPLAMLQKGGPAPRGPGGEGQPAKAQPEKKAAAPASKTRQQVEAIRKALAEPVADIDWRPGLLLRELLPDLEKKHGFPKIVINQASFKDENPDTPDLLETVIDRLREQDIPRGKLLRLILDKIPTGNASYLVRPGYIEVLTSERSDPMAQFI